MFEIIERKGQVHIRLSRGDSMQLETIPFTDTNENKKYDPDTDDKPIVLGEDDYVLFCMYSGSGRKYLSKLLTKDDYNEQQVLTLTLKPKDTINLQPYCYNFSFTYMPHKGEEAYTYVEGIFEIMPSCNAINEILKEEPIPIEPTDPDTGNTEMGDNNG